MLKLAGAAYLVWLGIKLWRAGAALDAKPRTDAASSIRMLGHAWLVTALNPKGLTFFVAFLPQFVDPKAALLPQLGSSGDFPDPRLRQCADLCPRRVEGPQGGPEPPGDDHRQPDGRQPAHRRRRGRRDFARGMTRRPGWRFLGRLFGA